MTKDFWEGYVPEPGKPAPMTKDEAMDLALEALEDLQRQYSIYPNSFWDWSKGRNAITAIKQARALDKKAENARELGLDYEPVQEPVALPCCGYTDASAVKWNPFNGVVQCHNCGQTYTPPATPVQEHVTDGSPCWCEPETSYTDSETGASVVVHKEPQ